MSQQLPRVIFPESTKRKHVSYSGFSSSRQTSSAMLELLPATDLDEIGGRVSLSDAADLQNRETSDITIHVSEHLPQREYRSKSYHHPSIPLERIDKHKHVSFDNFYYAKDKSQFPPLNLQQKSLTTNLQLTTSADTVEKHQSEPIIDNMASKGFETVPEIGSKEVFEGVRIGSATRVGSTTSRQSKEQLNETEKPDVELENEVSEISEDITQPFTLEADANETSTGLNELNVPNQSAEKLSSYSEEDSISTEIDIETEPTRENESATSLNETLE